MTRETQARGPADPAGAPSAPRAGPNGRDGVAGAGTSP